MRVKIAEARATLGITQEELANRIKVSRPYLAQLESGVRNLTAQRQRQIADALGVPPERLIDFDAPDVDEETKILLAFRNLSKAQRNQWLTWADLILANDQRSDPET